MKASKGEKGSGTETVSRNTSAKAAKQNRKLKGISCINRNPQDK
jgi:hypothetical protein